MQLEEILDPSFTGSITITRTPEGEPPEWVRRAWIGLQLPCYPLMDFGSGEGVLSGNESEPRWYFLVPQRVAIFLLAKHNSTAATWWITHGYSQGSDDCFGFTENEATINNGSVRRATTEELTEEMAGATDR